MPEAASSIFHTNRDTTRALAGGLLVVAQCAPVEAEPAVTSLLKSLDLAGYSSRTTPLHFSGGTVDARQVSMTDLRGKVAGTPARALIHASLAEPAPRPGAP